MASIDSDVVKHALKVAREHDYAEVELTNGEAAFRATLEPTSKKAKAAAAKASDDALTGADLLPVKATHVGYFRADGGKLSVGQTIGKGDVVASIASLGLANDVESAVSGEIVEVLVKDGDAVQFGQVLAQVRP
jgi:acetyl-CoA carboxylase biotin carboxyl carrier protein